jgi:hypothetical protein
VEETFQAGKNGTALDQYQVRKHSAWYRHVTLAMCAHAWLAVTAAASRPPPGAAPGTSDLPREGAASLRSTFRGRRRPVGPIWSLAATAGR